MLLCTAVLITSVLLALVLGSMAYAAGPGTSPQVIVELQQKNGSDVTHPSTFGGQPIGGTDGATRQAYKFQRERAGKHFSYTIANLEPGASYEVELSFVEHDNASTGSRAFNVYIQGTPVLNRLDIFAHVGRDFACQSGFDATATAKGLISVEFRSDESGCTGQATVSTIRLSRGGADAVEIDASTSRNKLTPSSPRRLNTGTQDAYEAVLGRLGSRASIDLAPQQLGWRYSPLGTWTPDLSELVIALKYGKEIRALPFTDRFATWENLDQSESMTSVSYRCSSSDVPLQMNVTFRAPFYPKNEKVSSAPFFYIDVTVRNVGSRPASAGLMLARPHKEDLSEAGIARFTSGGATGITNRTRYSYQDETKTSYNSKSATEALALPDGEASGVTFLGNAAAEFHAFTASKLWGWSAPGYPCAPAEADSPVFGFYPRGYTGAKWTADKLAPGASVTKHFIIAGYVADRILRVKNSSYEDSGFKFRYTGSFANVLGVAGYAASNRDTGDDIVGKSEFFDDTIGSDDFLSVNASYKGDLRNLIACSFRTYLTNTWWASSPTGRNWFSVWEGTWMRFQGTVDVEYNQAWFYYQYWPSLLRTVMDEWLLYLKSNERGVFVPHDIGIVDAATGQAYDHDMPVEENLNFILMAYRYWKASGDTSYVKARFATLARLASFVTACDTNGNGIPDVDCPTTFDDATPALERGRDQSYLGFKCLAAYQAMRAMALAAKPSSAAGFRSRVELINQTLEHDLWLGDHFAVCLDGDVERADREAYSIQTGGGLLFALGAQRDSGVTSENMARLRKDIESSTARTWGAYGSKHTSYGYDPGRMWVSSNIWRDALACYTGARPRGADPLTAVDSYWALERYLGMYADGGYWDGIVGGTNTAGGGSSGNGIPPPTAILAERPVYFNYNGAWTGGHDVIGATNPSSTFYFAEGSCRPGFDPYICIQNPGASWADVRITYMPGNGATKSQALRVAPHSRSTVRPRDTLGVANDNAHDFSAKVESTNGVGIIAERPVYFNYNGAWTGGHDVVGATNPSSTFYFAEGSCRPGFDPYICIQNPEPVQADVKITYMLADGSTRSSTLKVAPNSRATVRPKDTLGVADDDAHDFSAKVEATNGTAGLPLMSYYPRGTASLALIDAAAGLVLDDPGNALYYDAGTLPLKVPVLNRADWANPDPSRRVPVLDFSDSRTDPKITNEALLPGTHGPASVRDLENVTVSGHPLDPASGTPGIAKISYRLPEGATVNVSIWDGSDEVRRFTAARMGAGTHALAWNGKRDDGTPAADGLYRARIDAAPDNAAHSIRPASAQVWVNSSVPSLSKEWYFAEGYTGRSPATGRYEEYVLVQNPGAKRASLEATFLVKGKGSIRRSLIAPPHSRTTIRVADIVGEAEVSVCLSSSSPVAAERSMYFNARRAGHASAGASSPGKTWYLAEGCTRPGFDEYVLIMNPGVEPAKVTAVFMTGSTRPVERSYEVPARSRVTVDVNREIPGQDVSCGVTSDRPVVVERSQYLNYMTAGTCSIGARSRSRTWYFAEGYTGGGFEEFVLLQNPGPAPSAVTLKFMDGSGICNVRTYTVGARSRATVRVNDAVPSSDVSIEVEAARPIVAERAMYWNKRSDGHASIGSPSPDTEWYVPEGFTGSGFETYVLVQNPGDAARAISVAFSEPSGKSFSRRYTVPARGRFTIPVNQLVPSAEVSTAVVADGPVIVESSMYFDGRAGGTSSVGIRGTDQAP